MPKSANWVELLEQRASDALPRPPFAFLEDPTSTTPILTWTALFQSARLVAGHLQQRAKPGDRVMLLHPPGLDYVSSFYGCLLAGMLAVPAYPLKNNRSAQRLARIVQDCQPALALTTRALYDPMQRAVSKTPELENLPWLFRDEWVGSDAPSWKRPALPTDAPALLQYTSGSTGEPRGVVVTHANLLHNVAAIQQMAKLTPEDVGLCWLPPYHDMGLIGGILLPVFVGGSVLLTSPLSVMQDPLRWLSAISTHRITISGGPNFAYDWCVRKIAVEALENLDLSCWRVAFCGSEPVRAGTLEAFRHAFERCGFRRTSFFPTYGLAEATLMVSGGGPADRPVVLPIDSAALADHRVVARPEPEEGSTRLVGCGVPLADQKLAIVEPNTGQRLEEDRIGEIWVSGPSVAAGYFHRPQETRQTFAARLDGEMQDTPFLRTGDLGFLHGGELFVTGRLKDLIIVRGRNLYPHDLEETAGAAHPLLRKGFGIAFAVETETDVRVVLVQEVERECPAEELPRIAADIRGRVAEEQEVHLDRVLLVPMLALPRTTSGKLQRHSCRKQYLAGALRILGDFGSESPDSFCEVPAPGVGDMDTSERAEALLRPTVKNIVTDLQRCVAGQLRLSAAQVPTDRPLYPLGLDSLMVIALKAHIHQRWGVDLAVSSLDPEASIVTLAERICELRAVEAGMAETSTDGSSSASFPASAGVLDRVRAFTLPREARALGLMPFFREIEANDGATCRINGREVLMFGSNNYLGLTTDPRVRQAAAEAALRLGPSLTGSRLLNGSTPQHRALERKLAAFLGHPDALVFTTGYQAVAGTVSALMTPETTLLADAHAHASILDGAAIARGRLLTFRHNDPQDLRLRLQEFAGRSPVLVAVDGVYSMLGDVAPLPEILSLCREHGAALLVDDAHGLGVLGPEGRGTEAHFGLIGQTILCGTFSKSLASIGGFVAGDEQLLDWIRFHARPMLFSAAIPPPAVAAAEAALDILQAEPERVETLLALARHWRSGLTVRGFHVGPSESATVPVLVGAEKGCVVFSQALLEAGVFVNPVLPPAVPAGSALIRTSVMATHTWEEINRALNIFAEVGQKLGVV